MKKLFRKEFVIGLSVIVALVILIFGIDYLKGINLFQPANFYVARYDNVAGLETAAPVTIDGFKVGQVRDIRFNYANPGKIEVLLALNKNLRIPKGSKAVIGSGLLNGAYVEIHMADSKEMVEVGGELATETSPDMMASISNDLLPSVKDVVPKVDSLLLNLNRLVSDPALAQSVKSLQSITANLNTTSAHLNTLMGKEVPRLAGNANKVAANLDSITADLTVLSARLKQLPVDRTVDDLNATIANLAQFSAQLNDKNSTLGMLMNDPELYNRINRVAADVDSLIVDIKKNPKRYISIKLL